LLSKKNGTGDLFLDTGNYTFPFDINLPANLPTSFEHRDAKIRYFLCAIIEIPWSLNNKTFKLPITIICLTDLNKIPRLKLYSASSNRKVLCCFCCKSKPIHIILSILKFGYVAGEGNKKK